MVSGNDYGLEYFGNDFIEQVVTASYLEIDIEYAYKYLKPSLKEAFHIYQREFEIRFCTDHALNKDYTKPKFMPPRFFYGMVKESSVYMLLLGTAVPDGQGNEFLTFYSYYYFDENGQKIHDYPEIYYRQYG
ncbi:MAG: hypothetical protein Fur003_6130 [Candidatus Dojkabacteria bacterium]